MEGEIRSIRDQMHSDNSTITPALGAQRDAVAGTFQDIRQALAKIDEGTAKIIGALDAQQEILAGFMERTVQRFEAIITLVEGDQEWRGKVDERLDALERKQAG